MSEDPDVFLNYVETSQERERVLALLHPDVRAVVEQYMADHPGISAKKAINATGGLSALVADLFMQPTAMWLINLSQRLRGTAGSREAGGVNGRRGGVSRPSTS